MTTEPREIGRKWVHGQWCQAVFVSGVQITLWTSGDPLTEPRETKKAPKTEHPGDKSY